MRILFILLFICLFFSCKKNNEPPIYEQQISGLLIHNVSRQMLAGHKVDLYVIESWIDKSRTDPAEYPDGLPTYNTIKYSSITDSSGGFTFKFKPQHDWTYDLHINTADLIFAGSNRWGSTRIPRTPNMAHQVTDTLYAEKPAYINYFIQNVAPGYDNDSLHVNWTQGNYTRNHKLGSYTWLNLFSMVYYIYPGTRFLYSGANINKQFRDTVPSEGTGKYYIKWIHSRNGIVQDIQDSIIVAPFTTSTYSIHY